MAALHATLGLPSGGANAAVRAFLGAAGLLECKTAAVEDSGRRAARLGTAEQAFSLTVRVAPSLPVHADCVPFSCLLIVAACTNLRVGMRLHVPTCEWAQTQMAGQ